MSTKQMVMEEQDKTAMQGQNKINLKVVAFQMAIEIGKQDNKRDVFKIYKDIMVELLAED